MPTTDGPDTSLGHPPHLTYRIEVVALRAPEVTALGLSLGALLNTSIALVQLRITIVQIAALQAQLRATSAT